MRKNRNALCIATCGKAKIWKREPKCRNVPAREVYIGSFASAARAYAECFYGSWVILSAKHGLLRPTDRVDGPYEVTFKRKREPAVITHEKLRGQVGRKGLGHFREIVVVAGKDYVEPVRAASGDQVRIITPLHGMTSLGAMISALRKAIATRQPIK